VPINVPTPVSLISNSTVVSTPVNQRKTEIASIPQGLAKPTPVANNKNKVPLPVSSSVPLSEKFSPDRSNFPNTFTTATVQPTTFTPQSLVIPVPAPITAQIPNQNRVATNSEGYYSDPLLTNPTNNSIPQDTNTGEPAVGFIWPAKGVLTSGYGWRWGRMHQGVDIGGPIGTPIVAAADGVVKFSGWNSGGFGKFVEILHNDGKVTRYAHNNKLWVATGQTVRQGEQIAELGNTGRSTGPHLHFEIRTNSGSAVNPISLLPRRA
jgi:murein DD-endopeptidase MepM/ murein hydrolase activator NlpD